MPIVRYRYRAYPTPPQQDMLVRTFGCARVVFNDALRALARTRLARSVHDAGWATLVRVIEEKAARHHRQVVKVGRWFPSQLCATCGHRDGPKPLDVRSWTCTSCGTGHDRDINAARNILVEGRRLAAGLADNANACGGDVSREPALAVAGEAGTRRGAA